jgi:hypothetical protein
MLIDLIPYIIGAIFLASLVLGYLEWKKWKRIDKLNEIYYRQTTKRK